MSIPVLVSGASGHLGRRVIELLLKEQIYPIIATTRTPDDIADLANQEVDVRSADFDFPDTLGTSFAGAERMLLISTDRLDGTGRRIQQHRNAIEGARETGIRHIVYTSFLKAASSPLVSVAADHVATEMMLQESGVGYTILRNAFYTEMLLTQLLPAIASGRLLSASNGKGIAYVTREDCAHAAATAIISNVQENRILEITGPEVVNPTELATLAGELSGKDIDVVNLTPDAFQRELTAQGVSPQMAYVLADIERGVSEGAMDLVSADYEKLTGRRPVSVGEYIRAHWDKM